MASPALALAQPPQPQPQPALAEARRWIEQVTGKTFGDKYFRSGLENGVLLCELLNSILPGLVTKINRSPTPIAGLDNIASFLRGCREVGLKESQLFDPGDLQEATSRTTIKNLDGSRKLKNILVTIYWLGKTANNSAHFNGPPLNLKEFEGLLTQMKKDTEDIESPKRSIRDSGYVDCWDSERSDSLSPPRHGRDDSFDSLDSFGSRSQQTPSPDVVLRGSSDGRGSDSESDLPHRKLPDVKKDDMSARRTSYSEPKSFVPFNQYLPNKSNQTAYIPAPLRKKKAERDDFRKSWSTTVSPRGGGGGERPFSKEHPETIEEEPMVPLDGDLVSSSTTSASPLGPKNQFLTCCDNQTAAPQNEKKDPEEIGKLRRLEQAGIKIRPAAHRCGGSPKPASRGNELTPDNVLHQENLFVWCRPQNDTGSEEDEDSRIPDLEKDDFAVRRSRLNRREAALPFTHFLLPPSAKKDWNRREERKIHTNNQECLSGKKVPVTSAERETLKEGQPSLQDEGTAKTPETHSHGLAKKPTQASSSQADFLSCGKASITPKDKEMWDRLKVSGEMSEISLPDSDGRKLSVRDVCAEARRQRSSTLSQCEENSKEASDDRFPDLERDDMMVRRFGIFPKPISPLNPATHLATCNAPLKCQRKVVGQREPKLQPKAEKTERLLNPSRLCVRREPGHGAPSFISKDRKEDKNDTESEKAGVQNPEKEHAMLRSTGTLSKQTESSVGRLVPLRFSKQTNVEEKLLRTEQQAKSVLATDSVGAEQFCAEICQSVATQPSYTPEYKRPSTTSLAQEDICSVVDKDTPGARVIPAEMQKHLEINGKHLATLEAEPLQISSCRAPVSDDTESVSMCDMRCPDEGAVNQPHSKSRHEKLQIIHHQLKEDEDQWQDDLARWKNRRRSASQDLLKKEAERKKMEQLLIGGEGSNERRKSIKTYREIVEEKEKRERELHEAYKNARSQEEADRILQHYIERFTISEAVLERLEMPKVLERSHSVEPNASPPPKDPNPLRYLRQQSLPAPKFTATFEATIIPTTGSEAGMSTSSPSSSRPSGCMAMPLVTPKPYSQPKESREVLRNVKVDGKITVNGEASNGVEGDPDKEFSAFLFEPSPGLSTKSDHVVESPGASMEGSADSIPPEPLQKSLIEHALPGEQVDSCKEEADLASRKERTGSEKTFLGPAHVEPSTMFSCVNLLAAKVEVASFHNDSNETESRPELNLTQEAETHERVDEKGAETSDSQKVQIDTLEAPNPGEDLPFSLPETSHGALQDAPLQEQKAAAENRDTSNRSTCWSWDPEEERRRQERWQQEQERLLQERYQKEQEKLKKEWEKAQKEVEEEERKYYEEERKILEDTLVPFMLASSSAEPLSTSSSLTDGNRTMNLIDLSYSEDDKKPNEEAKLKTLFHEQDGAKYKECQPREENSSTVNKEEYLDGLNWRQKDEIPTPERRSPNNMSLPLCPDVLWKQPLPAEQSPCISDIRQKDSQPGYNLGQPDSSPKEVRRSISGKKLCSSCGLPLGKGAAMIIETLSLYFHIQCFRCGICKGQVGDAKTGTDVRIKSGLLTCSDCYIKSRTAGQPTTL